MRDIGRISDISAEGCCVSTDSLFFKVGTRVVIRPEGMEGITAIIRWISREKTGVQFDSPLYGPIVDHLVLHYPCGQPVSLKTY